MKKIAVALAGCGHLDGSEIREAIITLLEIDCNNAESFIFAPNINQHHVVNHLNGEETTGEKRNVLQEAARIARGKIEDLNKLDPKNFDALILPGGFGAAKNLADIAFKGENGTVIPALKAIINKFVELGKPVGAICISPALLASALKEKFKPNLTLGNESDLLSKMGVISTKCNTEDIIFDEKHKLVSTPAYMHNDRISNVATGIAKLVKKVIEVA